MRESDFNWSGWCCRASPDGSLDFSRTIWRRPSSSSTRHPTSTGGSLTIWRISSMAAHQRGGVVILDAAQTMGHDVTAAAQTLRLRCRLRLCPQDVRPEPGFIVIAKDFLSELDCFFLGGGTVAMSAETISIFSIRPTKPSRAWNRAAGFRRHRGPRGAIDWLEKHRPEDRSAQHHCYDGSRIVSPTTG
jgi:hypothetical protein